MALHAAHVHVQYTYTYTYTYCTVVPYETTVVYTVRKQERRADLSSQRAFEHVPGAGVERRRHEGRRAEVARVELLADPLVEHLGRRAASAWRRKRTWGGRDRMCQRTQALPLRGLLRAHREWCRARTHQVVHVIRLEHRA